MSADEVTTTVVLRVVNLGTQARLPDRPGDMERAIEKAILEAAVEVTRLAERNRVVLFHEPAEITIHVNMKVSGVEVPGDLDIEEVRPNVQQLPQSVWRNGVLYSVSEESSRKG